LNSFVPHCKRTRGPLSEKLESLFIGKSKQPRCFKGADGKKRTAQQLGFEYHNNKKAWMNQDIFTPYVTQPEMEQNSDILSSYIRKWDAKLRSQGRHIALTLDNFSAHYMKDYTPTNILLVFFEPNLTAWIQPLDAGIIRCMKAHYQGEQCLRALDLDEAGEEDIWEMNQLESMRMTKAAWKAVLVATISNCWHHTGILPPKGGVGPGCESEAVWEAWEVVVKFASTDMTLPQAESTLKDRLGGQYDAKQWEGPLKAVMDAEGDCHAVDGLSKRRVDTERVEWKR
jgi:hypothetical protein